MEIPRKIFKKNHAMGWTGAALTTLITGITYKAYAALKAPMAAKVAANQVNDSIANYVVHMQMSYGNLVEGAIVIVGTIITLLFLIPTITDLVGQAKE